jgi:replicative DNA helicase
VQELSKITRGLKGLARELNVPVMALSQLSRGVEARTNKRPMLSDLRESGCLTADTKIVRADTGQEVTLGELYRSGERNIPVWTLDKNLRIVRGVMTHVFSSGVKQTYQLTLRSGRTIKASANHPFLKLAGWTALDQLKPGDRIAIPRTLPEPARVKAWPDEHVILLAHLIGDGSFVKRQPIRYTSTNAENLEAVTAAAQVFGIMAKPKFHEAARSTQLLLPAPYRLTHEVRNPVAAWLDQLGLFGEVVKCELLQTLANSDVFWDEVEFIVPLGSEEVFDATVPGTHNFIANGIVVHNSIEQDADIVIMLYRDDYYNPDSPERNIAEVIIVKHRNGPTGTVKLLFENQFTRFLNLSTGNH